MNKQEKLDVFNKVLDVLKQYSRENTYTGICYALYKAVKRSDDTWDRLMIYVNPYKPHDAGFYWWRCDETGQKRRLEVIGEIIKEIEQEE